MTTPRVSLARPISTPTQRGLALISRALIPRRILTALFLMLMVAGGPGVRAQEEALSLEDLVQQGQEWIKENVDTNVVAALGEVDLDQLNPLLREIQRRFLGDRVLDLAALRDGATNLVEALQADDQTRPYAEWLRARLDYFDVAEELEQAAPKPRPDEPQLPPGNPLPELERKVWSRRLAMRPPPTGAAAGVAALKSQFTAQKVPPELVWVAEVESSFNPNARSPAGAAGLFQLMPTTAKALGLRLSPRDERLDPDRSAAAAARYLGQLYGQFKDWRLALAAYNAGEGRVRDLLKRQRATSFDAIATRLPAETQLYVPKVEAVILRREGRALGELKPPTG